MMTKMTQELQRIWHSAVHEWNRKRTLKRVRRPFWDTVILTAANAKQACGYRLEINRRREIGMIDAQTRVMIVTDRAGKRIGSGGATLWALKNYAEEIVDAGEKVESVETLFEGQRILLMHCGGEGRRVPSSAGAGKLFAALPFEVMPGRSAATFDALYVFLSVCAERMDEGLVVVSGDVMTVFDPDALHWKRGGCSGIGIPAPLSLASQHGIYVADTSGRRVGDYVQKLSPDEIREQGAEYDEGRALVDGAGILRFSPQVSSVLTRLAGVEDVEGHVKIGPGLIESRKRGGVGIDLYTDIAWPLVPSMDQGRYFSQLSRGEDFIRRQLWDALHGTDFWLDVIDKSIFIHLGNLWQILEAFSSAESEQEGKTSGDAAAVFGSCTVLASHVPETVRLAAHAHVQNSFLDGARGEIGPYSLVAGCFVSGQLRVGARSLLRGISTEFSLAINSEVALFAIPLLKQAGEPDCVAYCVHGVADNPKEMFNDDAKFLGESIQNWMKRMGVACAEVWRGIADEERSLWNARLFPIAYSEREAKKALDIALWMQGEKGGTVGAKDWRKHPRISFSEAFERIDYEKGFYQQEELARRSLLASIRRELEARRDPRAYLQNIGSAREFGLLLDALKVWIEEVENPLLAARLLAFEAECMASARFRDLCCSSGKKGVPEAYSISEKSRLERWQSARTASLRKVAAAVSAGVARSAPLDLSRVKSDRVVIQSPARIDFGGGWTDTPPQCLEQGGVILSAAIRLNGKFPIRVEGEKIEERVLRLESDAARGADVLRTADDLSLFQSLQDPFGLVKAGLGAVGFRADGTGKGANLAECLEEWGHGLRIVTHGNVPKGSGLGTSSILGAAVVACLRRLFGATIDQDSDRMTIFRQVLYLEQLLTSGGGWQDQIGALVPGIKLASVPADAGFVLRPKVEPVNLPSDILNELQNRLVLFYVGKRRVAFNMLQQIVGGYLAGNPDSMHALRALYDLVFEQRESLLAGDLDRLGAQMTRSRMLYRLLFSGTTSDFIETLFAAAAPFVSGGKCVGAGGGGFVMIMARSSKDADKVRDRLKEFSWRGQGEFYDFDFDLTGLHEVV